MTSPFRQISQRRKPSFPGISNRKFQDVDNPTFTSKISVVPKDLNLENMKNFLTSYPQILEDIVLDTVDVDKLSSWIQKKSKITSGNPDIQKTPLLQDRYSLPDMVMIQSTVLSALDAREDFMPYLAELLNVIARAINSNSAAMYVVRGGARELCLFVPSSGDLHNYQLGMCAPITLNTTVAAHVAFTRIGLLAHDLYLDPRFPNRTGVADSLLHSVICIPVMLPTSDIICVIELGRNFHFPVFTDVEFQLVTAMFSWAGLALHQQKIANQLSKQIELNDFLLEISRIIFNDVVEMDVLVQNIMLYAKELVRADRCALFLVDHDKCELYANLFDEGQTQNGKAVFSKKPTLRFSMEKGIAGLVARTAEVVNIKDAYADPRFNREVDVLTGYTTRSILCMPIISHGVVIGIIQMINKLSDHKGDKGSTGNVFSTTDESAFNMFAIYCALALHYSKVYGEMKYKSAQVSVMDDRLTYHSQCTELELRIFMNHFHPREVPSNFDSFHFYGPRTHDDQLMQLFAYMLENLFGVDCYNKLKLCNLITTIRKNYRQLAYHNFQHGWNVAHCMYCVLTRISKSGVISNLRMQALMIGSLCHDLDHQGVNNAFYLQYNHPLAQLYPNSTAEYHHFESTMSILKREENNIFSNLPAAEFKQLTKYIKHCILSSDIAQYFPNHKRLSGLIATQMFSLSNASHLDDVIAILMAGCDLCAVCKRWEDHLTAIHDMYDEFYSQGDQEKAVGDVPAPMMNRDNKNLIPQDQVGFFKLVCVPCYQSLAKVIPESSELLVGCSDNLSQWERVIAGKNTDIWEPEKSIVQPKSYRKSLFSPRVT